MYYEKYFLDDTEAGHDRLRILNELYNKSTLANLVAAGMGVGARVLEVGTGAGILTREIAAIVGSEGSILSVDRSAEQIDSFRSRDMPRNIELRHLALSELDQIGEQFDFVIARWLLLHLTDTLEGVRTMARRVAADGVLAIEDCVTATAFCHPPTSCFEQFLSGWLDVSRREDIAADAGDQLIGLFESAGFSVQCLQYHHPILVTPEARRLPAMSFSESSAIHVRHAIYSSTEIDAITGDLAALADSGHTMGFVRNTFVAGRRKAG